MVFVRLGRSRTIKKCAQTLQEERGDNVAATTLYRLCQQGRWVMRAEAHDADQDRRYAAELEAQRKGMISRHVKLAGALTRTAVDALRELDSLDSSAMSPADVVRYLKLATDVERSALGMPTHAVQVTGPQSGPLQVEDLSGLDPQARRQRLAQIAAEIARRANLDDDDGVYPTDLANGDVADDE